ncbi:MAG: T9SS type A sorting domain-containing protein [Bacteroidota bacterium]
MCQPANMGFIPYSLLLIFLCTSTLLQAQATQDFESAPAGTLPYTDTGDPAIAHSLVTNDLPELQLNLPADVENGILGCQVTFEPTRTGSSAVGLTDGDVFGVTDIGQSIDGGTLSIDYATQPPPFGGTKVYTAEDSDGLTIIRFNAVDLTGTVDARFSMNYIINSTTWETSDGAADHIRIYLDIDDGQEEIDLFIPAPGQVPTSEVWEQLFFSFANYEGSIVRLIIEFDTNSASEEVAFDNINFTQGTIISEDPCAVDSESPQLQCPDNFTVEASPGFCDVGLQNQVSVTVFDNCNMDLEPTFVPDINSPEAFFPIGTYSFTAFAEDGGGNVGTCNFLVTVIDVEPPVFDEIPDTVFQETNTENCTYIVQGDELDLSTPFDCSPPVVVVYDLTQGPTLEGVEYELENVFITSYDISGQAIDQQQNTSTFSYVLTVLPGDGCITSLTEADIETLELDLFPNPARGLATIQFKAQDLQAYALEVIDMHGRVVHHNDLGNASEGWYRQDIETIGWPSGLYVVQIHSDRGTFGRKLHVE